jgi:pimeloyl-ACP methyl ester carboxylesterase
MHASSEFGAQFALTLLGFGLGLAFLFVLAVVEWGAWALVRPGRKFGASGSEPPNSREIEVQSADRARLRGSWLPSETPLGHTAVLLHGFAEDRHALWNRAQALHARGWNVALLDARGRGMSEGDYCSFGGRETDDLVLWINALAARVGPSMQLVAWGRSMGAAIVLRAASVDPRIRGVVLEAPYPDLALTVAAWLRRARLPGLFARPILTRAKILAGVSLEWPRPVDIAPSVETPALIVHGSDDTIVRIERARVLHDAFSKSVEWVEVPGARHADVLDVGGATLIEQIIDFAERAVDPANQPVSNTAMD